MLFNGLITAMVTPFQQNNAFGIDKEGIQKLVDHLIDGGISGLFVLGTNGESYMMTEQEKIDLVKYTIEYVDGRVPVYVGTGYNTTLETVNLSRKMEELGADVLSIITPYFASLSDEELYNHYKTISDEVEIPIMLYNIPKRTGNDLSSELVRRLAKTDNIKGIKDSSGDLNKLTSYLEIAKDEDFHVLSGSDGAMLNALKLGVSGAVSGTSNVITKTDQAIFDYFNQGDLEQAKKMHDNIQPFRKTNHSATAPAVIKYSLNIRGIPVGEPRSPILPISGDLSQEVERVIKKYDELESDL